MNQKGLTPLVITLTIAVTLSLVGTAYYLGKNSQNNLQPQNLVQGANPTQSPSPETKTESLSANSKILPTLTPDPTASWKIYSNQKYGYSFKYPSTLLINDFETSYNQYAEVTQGRDPSGNAYVANYTVTVAKEDFQAKDAASVNFMSSDWTNTFYSMSVGDTKTAATVTFKKLPSQKVASQDAVVIEVVAVGSNQKRYLLKKNGYVYMISDFNGSEDFKNFLSAFKFTN